MLNDINIRWPTRDDYKYAIEDYHKNILDANLLRHGEPKSMNTYILNFGHPDSRTCIYRIGNIMIRCFCQADDHSYPPNDIFKRYQSLEKFIAQNRSQLSSFAPVTYIPRGIRVPLFDKLTGAYIKTADMPLVTMEYVRGHQMGDFIAENYWYSQRIHLLCDAWVRMIHEMEEARIAHGDLDLSNVFVQYDPANISLQLKLIDYDNTWIPAFEKDYPLPEYGHRPFQHPAFFGTPNAVFNREIDRFAALVIYISLKALTLRPDLYEEFGADDYRLLFNYTDYEYEQNGIPAHITQLSALHLEELDTYIYELLSSLREDRMPASLNTIATKQLNRSSVVISSNGPTQPLELSTPATGQNSTVILHDGSIEKIWIDWNAIQPPAHKNPKQPQQVIPVVNSINDQLQQRTTKKSHSNQSPNPPKNIDKLRKIVRNIIICAVLVAVILLIVIVFLVFVHNGKPTNVLQEISITLMVNGVKFDTSRKWVHTW